MKTGDKKLYLLIPMKAFIEVKGTIEETLNRTEADIEKENEQLRKQIQKEYPDYELFQGPNWVLRSTKD